MNPIVLVLPVVLMGLLLTVSIVQRRRLRRVLPGTIVCPACGAAAAEKPSLSFLGFISSRCSACSLKFDQPLPAFFRAAYILLAVLVVASSVANGLSVIAILYLVAIAAAIGFDIRAVRYAKRNKQRA